MSASDKTRPKGDSPRGSKRGGGKSPPPSGGGPHGHSFGSGSGGKRVDPYYALSEATDFAYLPGDPSRGLPILIKLSAGMTAQKFATKDWGHHQVPGDLDDWLTIPMIYANPPAGLEDSEFCTATIDPKRVAMLAQDPLMSIIEAFELSDPVGFIQPPLDPECALAKPKKGKKSKPVIVATIDDGLSFANERFRKNDGTTRVEFLWDQERPTGFSKTQINGYLSASTHGGMIDEDEVYALASYGFGTSGHKSWARRVTHGAHVMDLACGLDPDNVTTDSPRIIGVQLPSAVTADTSGIHLGAHVISALVYIIWHADCVAERLGTGSLPIVVNLSYGLYHGPHDGTSFLEWAIDAITQARRTINKFTVVLPAGNSHLERCHARFSLAPTKSQTLDWRVLPDDATPSFVDIWLPVGTATKTVDVTVTMPGGVPPITIREGDGLKPYPAIDPICWLWYPLTTTGRKVATIMIFPTSTLSPVDRVAPSGIWHITLSNVGQTLVECIDAWIYRDDTAMGYPIRGRQSYFDDPAYERFDEQTRLNEEDTGPSYVKRYGSISGIATGGETVVMGGWRWRYRLTRVAARYSSGATEVLGSPRPVASAQCEDSDACYGRLATGTRSRSVAAINGTSVATPQASRLISRLMEAGYNGHRGDVYNEALNILTPDIQEERGGAGAIDPKYRTVKVDRLGPY